MNPDHVHGAPLPDCGPEFRIIQLKRAERLDGIILSPSMWATFVHWDDFAGKKGRSQRCTRDSENSRCDGCDRVPALPRRWKAWLHVWSFACKGEVFLELTPAAGRSLLDQVPNGRTLRGLRLLAERSKGGDNGRLKIELANWLGEMSKFPPAKDPEPVLQLLWNWQR